MHVVIATDPPNTNFLEDGGGGQLSILIMCV